MKCFMECTSQVRHFVRQRFAPFDHRETSEKSQTSKKSQTSEN